VKPWSKLQREIYKLLVEGLDLQIQCRAYRMPESWSTTPQIPRFWITLGEDIIFDIPKNANYQQKHQMYDHIPNISNLIREYIDSPVDGLATKVFAKDTFGVTDILKAADRRIGRRQWDKLPQTEVVKKILEARKSL
jgi:hypothetical protein